MIYIYIYIYIHTHIWLWKQTSDELSSTSGSQGRKSGYHWKAVSHAHQLATQRRTYLEALQGFRPRADEGIGVSKGGVEKDVDDGRVSDAGGSQCLSCLPTALP